MDTTQQQQESSTQLRPSSLELSKPPTGFNQILEQLKNLPQVANSPLNFVKNNSLTIANMNNQHILNLCGLSAASSPQVSSVASLVFLPNAAGTTNTTPISVNLCSPVALTSGGQQPLSLNNYAINSTGHEVMQPVLFHGSQTAASGSRSRSNDSSVDHTQIQRLERKRARNRDAAKKCRERKLSLIHSLQGYVQQILEDNKALRSQISAEKEEVKRLKNFVVNHIEKDCDFIQGVSTDKSADPPVLSKKRKTND
ncbi:hypothetical protein Ciccas_004321 [Cichlidogyrus casuarinus]|uniref:BZIP domain-containing protein n=1 Tax=Cichlidogyrus casuarinus TaxID=1844966 RepID=A0ABD2QBY3_9PLAT